MTVDGADRPGNGCEVKTISPLGAVGKDGRIHVGDQVVSVNNEMVSPANYEQHALADDDEVMLMPPLKGG